MFKKLKNSFKKVVTAVAAFGSTLVAFLPAAAAETVDMNAVTSGVVSLVMALLPVIIVIVIVKAMIEAFARMT